ncbi:unnamed protein product, partial [Rotaria sp. Silwood2]
VAHEFVSLPAGLKDEG